MKRSELLAARTQLQADIQVSQGHLALLAATAENGTEEDEAAIAELQEGIARARHAISIIDQGLAAGLYEKEEEQL